VRREVSRDRATELGARRLENQMRRYQGETLAAKQPQPGQAETHGVPSAEQIEEPKIIPEDIEDRSSAAEEICVDDGTVSDSQRGTQTDLGSAEHTPSGASLLNRHVDPESRAYNLSSLRLDPRFLIPRSLEVRPRPRGHEQSNARVEFSPHDPATDDPVELPGFPEKLGLSDEEVNNTDLYLNADYVDGRPSVRRRLSWPLLPSEFRSTWW
jgi:hypothetical protein